VSVEPTDLPDVVDSGEPVKPGAPERTPVSRRHLLLLIGPIILLVIANYIGGALAPDLVSRNPLLLIALSVPNRNLIAVSHSVPLPAYFVVGFLRLIAPDYFFYALGYHYGDRAITWMERRTRTAGLMMRQLEELFGKAGHVLVLIMPNNPVCLLAGGARMRKSVFWTINIIGTIGRLIIMWWIGELFEGWINAFLGFISDQRVPLLAATVTIAVITLASELRRGTTEIQQLLELEGELEGGDAPSETRDEQDEAAANASPPPHSDVP
jgi:membrane protein DedA with SNARE-associated domain